MWKLKIVGDSILEQYAQEMIPSLRNRIVDGRVIKKECFSLTPDQIEILIPKYDTQYEDLSILRALLVSDPKTLYEKCNDIMLALTHNNYDENEFSDYLKAKRKKKRNEIEKALVDKYSILNTIQALFNYEDQISKNKERSYWLTNVKDAEVCTYCNRQYSFTVIKGKSAKSSEYIVRPELDHWFSKEMYPLMSLSFYNLIPSCHICNSTAKGNALFNLSEFIHPYIQKDDNPNITFRPTLVPFASRKYGVVIDRILNSREDHTIKAFALDEIYAYHGSLEVDDLMRFNYAYSDGYLKSLFEQVLSNHLGTKSKSEVYRMLFGTELEPKDFGKRPLSKLKYDILKYLKVI